MANEKNIIYSDLCNGFFENAISTLDDAYAKTSATESNFNKNNSGGETVLQAFLGHRNIISKALAKSGKNDHESISLYQLFYNTSKLLKNAGVKFKDVEELIAQKTREIGE